MPMISVIVPVYKVEPYLARCVDSILAQTYTDFELILVDDGSPDHCGAICDEYAKQDKRVHVIHQSNGGLSAARNTGIDWAFANSDSQWLTFIDSDDWVHPEFLERLMSAAKQTGTRISICGYCEPSETMMPELTEEQKQVITYEPEKFWCEKNVNATVAWAKIYRKELFRDIRYPVGKLHEDEMTSYKLLFGVEKIAVTVAPMYCYFINQDGIMRSHWTPKHLSALDALEEQMEFFARNGYLEARKYNQRNYLRWSVGTIKKLREIGFSDPEIKEAHKTIMHRLRRHLIKNKSDLPYSWYQEAYELAFSRFFQTYHFLGKLLRGRKRRQ